jgi:ribosomal protein S12 methylthiotransferase
LENERAATAGSFLGVWGGKIFMAIKVGLISLGCPKNTVDSETMLGRLQDAGMEVCPNEEEADVLIVNTCGFKSDAAQESVQTLLESSEW